MEMNKLVDILAQAIGFIYNYRCLFRCLLYNLNDTR